MGRSRRRRPSRAALVGTAAGASLGLAGMAEARRLANGDQATLLRSARTTGPTRAVVGSLLVVQPRLLRLRLGPDRGLGRPTGWSGWSRFARSCWGSVSALRRTVGRIRARGCCLRQRSTTPNASWCFARSFGGNCPAFRRSASPSPIAAARWWPPGYSPSTSAATLIEACRPDRRAAGRRHRLRQGGCDERPRHRRWRHGRRLASP